MKYHKDISSRLCFLLGARRAIELMLAVKDAPANHFLILNLPKREKSMERVLDKVQKSITQQGYENAVLDGVDNVVIVSIVDRKVNPPKTEGVDNVANKYVLDEVQHKGLPQVILVRGASINSSMGADVTSGDIKTLPQIDNGEEVILLDIHYEVIGYGISQMSTEEIKRSPGRVAIRTQEGRYDVPKYHSDKRYMNGLYSVSTLPRIMGLELLEFTDKKAVILVISQDNGEIAVEAFNRAPPGSKVYLMIRNENHAKAVQSTFDRLQVERENFQIVKDPLDRFSKSRPKEKFTHFFLEMNSTETGMRPNPYFEMEEKNIIGNARNQFSALRSISLIGVKGAQIAYVTHSIDPTENEEVLCQGFRQGNFSPGVIPEDIRVKFPLSNSALPEIPTVTVQGSIDLQKMIEEADFAESWINIDPLKHKSDAGFVAKFYMKKR
ncbi:MAG: hypothetical protein INQ03_09960 [Candidatus Heimdallarchaeota archaeon]|nr:hypothetical protein [Candidatus Heimdallarchaeota archaeon]